MNKKSTSFVLEHDLAQRWHALPPAQSLPLINGEVCYLHYAGRSGGPQGPDIRDAVIQFAPEHGSKIAERVIGDVEFHIRCSDWYTHEHHTDPRYNNVILHVVLIFDSVGPVLCQDRRAIPVCSLNDLVPAIFPQSLWPCQCTLPSLQKEAQVGLLQHAGMSRFEQKTQYLLEQLQVSQPRAPFSAYDVCLIPALVEAMGYGRDRAFFRAVGERLVGLSSEIPEPAGRAPEPSPLDAGRLRISGRLVEQWRMQGAWEMIRKAIISQDDTNVNEGRPQGSPPHPTATPAPTMNDKRLNTHRNHCKGGGGAEMGEDPCGRPRPLTGGEGLNNHPYSSIEATAIIACLRTIFSDLSPARTDIVICNVVLPFAAAVAHVEHDQYLLEQAQGLYKIYPALPSNSVTRSMYRQLGLEREPRSACQQQGLHYIYAQTCQEKQCAACIVIGRDA